MLLVKWRILDKIHTEMRLMFRVKASNLNPCMEFSYHHILRLQNNNFFLTYMHLYTLIL